MAVAETARLIAELSLKDRLSAGSRSAVAGLARIEGGVGRVQGRLSTLTRNMGGKFTSALSTFGGRLKGFATAGLGFLGIGGLFAVSKAFTSSIEKAREFGDASIQLKRITGLNIDTTSRLVDALDFYGVTVEKVNKLAGMQIKNSGNLALTSEKAKKFQKQYGLQITDSSGRVLDFNKQLLASADFFNDKSIPAGQKAAALAKLYGRSWQDLIPVLALGRKGIEKAQQDAIHLSEADLEAITKNKEATRKWNDAIGDLQVKIGIGLLPTITELVTSLTGWVDTHGPEIQQFFRDGVQTLKGIGGTVLGIVSGIKSVWDGIPPGLRDLIIKGIVADRTIKFLFGVSVTGLVQSFAGGIAEALAKAVTNGIGTSFATAGLGKLFVQPVFVTNQGFGGGVGMAQSGGFIASLVAGIGAAVGGALVVSQVTNAPDALKNLGEGFDASGKGDIREAIAAIRRLADGGFVFPVPPGIFEPLLKAMEDLLPPVKSTPFVDKGDSGDRGVLTRKEQRIADKAAADAKKTQDRIDGAKNAIESSRIALSTKLGLQRDATEAARIAATTSSGLIVAAIGKPTPMSPDERQEFRELGAKGDRQRDAIEASRIALATKLGDVRTGVDGSRDATESMRIALNTKLGETKGAVDRGRDATEAMRIGLTTQLGNTRSSIVGGAHSDTDRIVQAIQRNAPKISVFVDKGDPGDRGGGKGGGGVLVTTKPTGPGHGS